MSKRAQSSDLGTPMEKIIQAVPDAIINRPYEEPTKHWRYPENGVPFEMGARRPASYYYTTRRTGDAQMDLLSAMEGSDDLPLVNRLREDVKRWREQGYRGASEVTKDLLRHWANPERSRRIFFCQLEAAETMIYLLELRIPGRSSKTGFKNFDCSDEDLQLMLTGNKPKWSMADSSIFPKLLDQPADASMIGLRRLGCKMATGSGKTIVMSMLIAWTCCNRGRNPSSTEFPNGILIVAPNLTVKNRLQVLKPEEAGNYYELFDIVPSRYREYMNSGRVFITNWHVFASKSENQEGGETYRVVQKGEEDSKAFTLDRLGELARRLPILVFNDEGHHCWRPKVEDAVTADDEILDKKGFEKEQIEARVWLDGLDRINNSGLLGAVGNTNRPCVLATIDMSATPFYLGGSGHPEGSPFPWLVSDFGLVDAIESGLVKIPRIPVLEEGGAGSKDDAGRPDPKYFALWQHIVANTKPSDKVGKANYKPESIYREAEGALKTIFSQWKKRFQQYRDAAPTQQTIPPAMIIVCHDTDTAQLFYERISGQKVEGEGKEAVEVFGTSEIAPELQNEKGVQRTLIITSAMLATLQSDDGSSKDEKVAEARRIVDTIGKANQPGEHIRCVVSVSMLTEGWDANNVTQILGIRAFKSQLLCEQVVGRGLRRRSYTVNDKGFFEAEYCDVYGIPFSLIPFKGRPKDTDAPDDKPKNSIKIVPGREALEIRIPKVENYVYQLSSGTIRCDIEKLEVFRVEGEPSAVLVEAVRGYKDVPEGSPVAGGGEYEKQDRSAYYESVHEQAIYFRIAHAVMSDLLEGADTPTEAKQAAQLAAKHQLFPQIFKIVQDYILKRAQFAPNINRKDIGLRKNVDRLVKILRDGIVPDATTSESPLMPVLNSMRRFISTKDGEEDTVRPIIPVTKCQLNAVAFRSGPEREAAEFFDDSQLVECFTANTRGLGFRLFYDYGDQQHSYEPDYIVRVKGGQMVIVEVKGEGGVIWDPNRVIAKNAAAKKWCAAVSNAKKFGQWNFEICHHVPGIVWQQRLNLALAKYTDFVPASLPFRDVVPREGEGYKTCVPVTNLRMAAGMFLRGQEDDARGLFDHEHWATYEGAPQFSEGMFIAQIKGKSMEPQIPDQSWCLFRPASAGTRNGKIMLVQHSRIYDSSYTGGYTVKRYKSERVCDEEGNQLHVKVALEPFNSEFETIELIAGEEDEFRLIAEFVEVIKG